MSSILQTKAALASGGITQDSFNQGLSSFFLMFDVQFHGKYSQRTPILLIVVLAVAMSNEQPPQEEYYKLWLLDALLALHPIDAVYVCSLVDDLKRFPNFPPQIAVLSVQLLKH
jgi:hypothetical protein